MAASIQAGYVFSSTEQVTAAKLATLVNSATISGIVNAEIAAGAAIAYSKLNLASSIVGSDLADSCVTSAKISAGCIVGSHLSAGCVGTAALAASAVYSAALLAGAVLSGAISAGNLVSAHFAASAVPSGAYKRFTMPLDTPTSAASGSMAYWGASGILAALATATASAHALLSDANKQPYWGAQSGGETLKAWVNFNGTGTIAIRDSFNVSGITDNGTGDYDVTWDTDFANVNYAIAGMASEACGMAVNQSAYLTTKINIYTRTLNAGTSTDTTVTTVLAIGDQ